MTVAPVPLQEAEAYAAGEVADDAGGGGDRLGEAAGGGAAR